MQAEIRYSLTRWDARRFAGGVLTLRGHLLGDGPTRIHFAILTDGDRPPP